MFLHLGHVFHYLVANLVLQLKGLAALHQLCYCSRVAVRYASFFTLKWFVLWSGSIAFSGHNYLRFVHTLI